MLTDTFNSRSDQYFSILFWTEKNPDHLTLLITGGDKTSPLLFDFSFQKICKGLVLRLLRLLIVSYKTFFGQRKGLKYFSFIVFKPFCGSIPTLLNIKFADYIWPPDCQKYSKIGKQTRLMNIQDSLYSNLPVQNFFLEKK